jgi:hypothetical protein
MLSGGRMEAERRKKKLNFFYRIKIFFFCCSTNLPKSLFMFRIFLEQKAGSENIYWPFFRRTIKIKGFK